MTGAGCANFKRYYYDIYAVLDILVLDDLFLAIILGFTPVLFRLLSLFQSIP